MLKLTIKVGPNTVDYSDYVDWTSIQVQEQLNMPGKIQFNLFAYNWKFRVPVQRGYVRLYPTSSNKPIFTGFISVPPTRQYVGLSAAGFRVLAPTGNDLLNSGGQILKYTCVATSDEYLLALKALPFIPAYINRTQGQILQSLAETLCPGYFDTSRIQDGDVVPYFNYDPTKAWHETAKTFGDASRFRYKAIDKKLFYVPYGDNTLGITYDEVNQPQSMFDPTQLQTQVLQVPTVNDVTVLGDAEAGNNHEDYFIGDGFTGNLQLKHKVFQGSSVILLQDALTSNDLNVQNWYEQDPGSNFSFESSAFNIITAQTEPFGANGTSYLGAQNGIEIAGGLNLQHGEFIFNDYCSGVLGGLYEDQTYSDTGFICGFKVSSQTSLTTSASGAEGVVIEPMFEETNVGGVQVVTQPNHTYVLQTIVHAPAYTRWTQTYRTVDGEEYGSGSLTMTGSVTFNIQDYDIGAATGFYYTPELTQCSIQEVALPDFCAYALVNNDVLNLTDTNMLLAKMPLGGLYGLQGSLGLFTPSGLALPALQDHNIWKVPPSGNYFNQPVPAVPFTGTINTMPTGNQYYVGSVTTWGIVIASTAQGGSTVQLAQETNTININGDWADYGPGDAAIPGAVTLQSSSGPTGGQQITDVCDSGSQSLRPAVENFDLIGKYSSAIDCTIANSQNVNNDKFAFSFKQTQPVQSQLMVMFRDNFSPTPRQSYHTFFFDSNSALGSWITLTASRSSFTTESGFDWTQISSIEVIPIAGQHIPYSYILFLAEFRWVGLVVVPPTDPTTTTSFISLISDPLFSTGGGPGEVVKDWVNQSDFPINASWGFLTGNPDIPGSASISFNLESGPLGLQTLSAGSDGHTGKASQVIQVGTNPGQLQVSSGDQFTIGVYGMATSIGPGIVAPGFDLMFGISATVLYSDGTTSSAAAGGILTQTNVWQTSSNQVLVDPVRTALNITATVFANWHNSSGITNTTDAGWTVNLTAAEMVKTPSAYSIYQSPVGLGIAPTNLVLGNGFDLQAAQITQGNDADTLAFYAQTSPTAGTPIRLQSWESQAAISRLQDKDSIAYEAYIAEDDGVRSTITTNLSPLPRTSEDCDNAALAFLADRTTANYSGTYQCTSQFFQPPVIVVPNDGFGQGGFGLTPFGGTIVDDQYWPTPGRFLHINAPPRDINAEEFLVTANNTSVLSEMDELVQFQITFGADLHLDKVLHNFVDLQPAQVLTPQDKANPPDPRFTVDVTTSYLPDLAATYIPLGAITPLQVFVQMNDIVPSGAWLEVRLLDSNWGDLTKRDFIGRFSPVKGDTFVLPRRAIDEQWFLRLVADASVDSSTTTSTYNISGNVTNLPSGGSSGSGAAATSTFELDGLDWFQPSSETGWTIDWDNFIFTYAIGTNSSDLPEGSTWSISSVSILHSGVEPPDGATLTINGNGSSYGPTLFSLTSSVDPTVINISPIVPANSSSTITITAGSSSQYDESDVSMVFTLTGPASEAGAILRILELDLEIISDNNGVWSFDGIPNGTYTVKPTLIGFNFSPPVQTVVINGTSVTGLHFAASTTLFVIAGKVVDHNSAPIITATVSWSGSGTGSVAVSKNGTFAFSVGAGSYTITASASGYTSGSQSINITNFNVNSLLFILVV